MKRQAINKKNRPKSEMKIIISMLLLALLISIPYIIHVIKISEIYLNNDVRDAVYESTIYLQSGHGILLSSLHLKDVHATGDVVVSEYDFNYPSTISICGDKRMSVSYDINTQSIIDYDIGYYEDGKIC